MICQFAHAQFSIQGALNFSLIWNYESNELREYVFSIKVKHANDASSSGRTVVYQNQFVTDSEHDPLVKFALCTTAKSIAINIFVIKFIANHYNHSNVPE